MPVEPSHPERQPAIDVTDPALPVAGTGKLSRVRKSTNARRRAWVLLGVHLLIAAHATQFLISGTTLSPVEPSEAMYTLELGEVNAGFIFLLLSAFATLVFGRFFCGWGCHLVALQDLCGWLMKKLGVRPRPFRSRLLIWVPMAAAIYMFVWPALKRGLTGVLERTGVIDALAERDLLGLVRELGIVTASGASFPGFSDHLMTDAFWKTFPGPLWAVLTFLTCGFAIVYLLGSKGFCTYACPYGAVYGTVDRFAPGRIVVNDDCEQCGHCSATCTSNVLVHEEVRRYGTVVDPGCMKCLDCVSVCPKGALSYGFTLPSIRKRKPADDRVIRKYPLTLGEEIFAFAVWFLATGTFRGLYDRFPLLMSIGLGAMTAFLALKLLQLARNPTVRLQNLKLKLAGRVSTAGWVFTVLTVAWMAFGVDSAFAQWHRKWGAYHLNRTEATREEVFSGEFARRTYSERHERSAERSFTHFRKADFWGLHDLVDVKLGLAWGYLLRGEDDLAEQEIRESLALAPARRGLHDDLIELLARRGRMEDAIEAARGKLSSVDANTVDRLQLVGLLAQGGRVDEALTELDSTRSAAEGDAPSLLQVAAAYQAMGEPDSALQMVESAIVADPSNAEARFRLAGLFVSSGRYEEAIEQYRVCIELAPDAAEPHYNLGALLRRAGRPEEAIVPLEVTRVIAPEDLATLIELGLTYSEAGRTVEALETLREAVELHPESVEVQLQLPQIIADLERRVSETSPTD